MYRYIYFCQYVVTGMQIAEMSRINITLASILQDDGEYYSPWISGGAFLFDGRLILCDPINHRIILLDKEFEIQETLSFPPNDFSLLNVWDVGVINDTTVVVSLPFSRQMQFIQVVPRLQHGIIVDVPRRCDGIDIYNNTIYIACIDGYIRLYDTNGHLKDKSRFIFYDPLYVAVSRLTGNYYITKFYRGSVTVTSPTGKILSTYDKSNLRRPEELLLDDHDNVIVADWKENCVQVIKNSDNTYKNILTAEDGIKKPYSLAYRRTDKTLVVGMKYQTWFQVLKFT